MRVFVSLEQGSYDNSECAGIFLKSLRFGDNKIYEGGLRLKIKLMFQNYQRSGNSFLQRPAN